MGILIADSGGSTTDWAFVNQNGTIEQSSTSGMNPNYTQIEELRSIVKNVFPHISRSAVSDVYMYSAGAAKAENKDCLRKVIEETFNTHIQIETDLLASAKALFGNEEGIACILGTGSNAGYFDGHSFTVQSPSMGYLLDDPGSGFHIGKQVLKDYFYGSLPKEIEAHLHNQFSLSRDEVLGMFYKKEFPNRYIAQFCLILSKFQDGAYANTLIKKCFNEFIDTELKFVLEQRSGAIGFTGSVAWAFKDILADTLAARKLELKTVYKKPIEGLIEFHRKNR